MSKQDHLPDTRLRRNCVEYLQTVPEWVANEANNGLQPARGDSLVDPRQPGPRHEGVGPPHYRERLENDWIQH